MKNQATKWGKILTSHRPAKSHTECTKNYTNKTLEFQMINHLNWHVPKETLQMANRLNRKVLNFNRDQGNTNYINPHVTPHQTHQNR